MKKAAIDKRLIAVTGVLLAMAAATDVLARQWKYTVPAHGWLAAGDVVVEDFEGEFKISPAGGKEDPGLWRSTGDAFPAAIQAETDLPYSWACGNHCISSSPSKDQHSFGDPATGTLTSPEFAVKKGYLTFLIAGPRNLQTIAVQLLHEGRIVRAATGSGGTAMRMVAFNISGFSGKNVRIRLIDKSSSVGGFIVVDRFVQTDKPSTKEVIADVPNLKPSVVRTLKGVVKGEVVGQGDHLTVNGQAVPMGTLLSWVNPVASSTDTAQGLRLRNGEFLSGTIEGYKGGVVTLSGVFGKHELKLSDISAIVFAKTSRSADKEAPNTLYRRVGDPIPGKLVWIKNTNLGRRNRARDIAVDSMMGTLPVPLEQVARYVIEPLKADAVVQGSLEVALSDGSILHSKTPKFKKGQLLLQHPILGDMQVELSTIAYMRRTPKGAVWLEAPGRTRAVGQMGPGVKPVMLGSGTKEACLSALRMHALSSATYGMPLSKRKGATLRGTLAAMSNSRADIKVLIKAAGKTVWRKSIVAGSDPVEVTLSLPPCKYFTIVVACNGKVAVPCGVEWMDAHLLPAQAAANITKGPNERS